ncbi:hypothetical protein [Nocardioides aequoreus]|uniref:hypothetical protein n=1 Tax=Nocardioides aequoreus TaxID=397278 RepID=UPI0004C45A18|nr:hypothetical protein [Nocardioides aequoreus]
MDPLTADQIQILNRASRAAIATVVADPALTSAAEWIPHTNAYFPNPLDQIKTDKEVPAAHHSDFLRYVANASIVHCGDGWSYLGRAVSALLQGDVNSAVHLAYYAELRAAMSLMGGHGIFITDRWNFVVESQSTITLLNKQPTHVATWQALSEWIQGGGAAALLGRVLHPENVPFAQWTSGLPSGGLRPAVEDLLQRVALDLQSFATDRNRRNDSTYNPTRLRPTDPSADDLRRMVLNLWAVLEPEGPGSFPVMDALLLEDVLVATYGAGHQILDNNGEAVGTDWSGWASWLHGVLPAQFLDGAVEARLASLSSGAASAPFLDAAFQTKSTGTHAVDFIEGMMMRTVILLRIATGSCVDLLDQAGLSVVDVQAWVDLLAEARGVWDAGDRPESPVDLWADVRDARDVLQNSSAANLFRMIQGLGAEGPVLAQAERVVAWSFA